MGSPEAISDRRGEAARPRIRLGRSLARRFLWQCAGPQASLERVAAGRTTRAEPERLCEERGSVSPKTFLSLVTPMLLVACTEPQGEGSSSGGGGGGGSTSTTSTTSTSTTSTGTEPGQTA